MKKFNLNKILFWCFILGFLTPSFVFAQTGNHLGEREYLTYRIEYLNPLGVTEVNKTGIIFKPFVCCESRIDTILPDRYLGNYPLYFAGTKFSFRVIIKNEGRRTYRNLIVETFQEFLNIEGGPGEPIGENNENIWLVEELGPKEEITLEEEFFIPRLGESGIDQTHLRISHLSSSQIIKGQVILEDFQAGLWCPLAK